MVVNFEQNRNTMKRYLLFMGANYYPEGGMKDLVGDFNDIADAIDAISDICEEKYDYERYSYDSYQEFLDYYSENNWYHIYDTHEKVKVMDNEKLELHEKTDDFIRKHIG